MTLCQWQHFQFMTLFQWQQVITLSVTTCSDTMSVTACSDMVSVTADCDIVSDSSLWNCQIPQVMILSVTAQCDNVSMTAHCDTVSVTTHCDTVSVTALYDSVIGDLTCIALGYGMISDDTFQLMHQCNFWQTSNSLNKIITRGQFICQMIICMLFLTVCHDSMSHDTDSSYSILVDAELWLVLVTVYQ